MRVTKTAAVVVLCAGLGGCVTSHLRDLTVDQSETLTEFQYRMVLDNLAMFRTDSASLPWHVQLSTGTAQLDASINPSGNYTWSPVSQTLGLSATGDVTVNWTLTPVLNDEQLANIRQRYQAATKPEKFSEDFDEGDHPEGHLYGHFGTRYVWPKPGHLDALVRLFLDITHDAYVSPTDEAGYNPAQRPQGGVALTPRH
jgi:hypothetical protein